MKVRQAVSVNGSGVSMNKEPDPRVVLKAERWQFSHEYKLRILAEADACRERGEIGALLPTSAMACAADASCGPLRRKRHRSRRAIPTTSAEIVGSSQPKSTPSTSSPTVLTCPRIYVKNKGRSPAIRRIP